MKDQAQTAGPPATTKKGQLEMNFLEKLSPARKKNGQQTGLRNEVLKAITVDFCLFDGNI